MESSHSNLDGLACRIITQTHLKSFRNPSAGGSSFSLRSKRLWQEEGIKRRHHFCPNPFIAETDLFLTLTLIFILHNNLASAATEVRCRQWGGGGLSSQDPISS